MDLDETEKRVPLHIRLMARWALISLLIAAVGLLLASVQPADWFVVSFALKILIGAASTIGVTALLLWVAFSGLHFAFNKRGDDEPKGDFFS